MGAEISKLRDMLLGGDKKAKEDVLQQLLFLVNAANSRLDIYQAEMDKQFRNREVEQETSVVGYRALRWERGYRVGVTRQATSGISEIIDGFFGDKKKNEDGKPVESPILSGFKKVVSTALDIILGNTMAGEQEDIKWFVFAHHNSIIRIDVRMWRYNFVGKGVMAESENVFCYVFCTSVVDHSILKADELVYLLSEHGGDENVEAYLTYLFRIWAKVKKLTDDPESALNTIVTLPKLVLMPSNLPEDKIVVGPIQEEQEKEKLKKETPEQKRKRENDARIQQAKDLVLKKQEVEVKKLVEAAEKQEELNILEDERKEKADKEAKEKAEKEAKEKATKEAKEKAEKEAKEKQKP